MRFRDAVEQVEREHPELKGKAKAAAIKALQDPEWGAKHAERAAQLTPPSYAWAVLGIWFVLPRLIAWAAWGHLWVPGWFGWPWLVITALIAWKTALLHREKRRQKRAGKADQAAV